MLRSLIAAAILLVCMSQAADARHRHKHYHHKKIVRIAKAPIQTSFWGTPDLVSEARRHLGATAAQLGLRPTLWCAAFFDKIVLPRLGLPRIHSDRARDFASYGRRVSGPQIGAIAVMTRGRRGGHVGVVSGISSSGNPIIISGNHGRRVAEAEYPRGRIYAYVVPNGLSGRYVSSIPFTMGMP